MVNISSTKLLGISSLSLIVANHQATAQKTDTKPRPNILLILADDMGYSDLGCFGSEIKTPNLDRLASEGLQMTRFYNASRSCPSRASLLTGLYQHEAGVGDMVNNLGVPAYQGYLNHTCVTLAEALKQNGYNTYLSGKWHVGETLENWPVNRGFDHTFGLIGGASNYFKLISYRVNQAPARMALDDKPWSPPDTGFYMTDAIGDFAVRFLGEEAPKPQPFFMYLAFTAPHWPLHALPQDIAKYRGKYMQGWEVMRKQRFERMKELDILDKNTVLSPVDPDSPKWDNLSQPDKEMWDLRMAVYAAMVDRLDQNVGKVLDKLRQMGELDNTLIIFLSDNGGCHEQIKNRENYIRTSAETGTPESFDSYEYPWANVSNTPFRLYKHWEHEGGISTPLIAWWPGKIKHHTDKTPGHIIDIMPTFMEAAQGIYPVEYKGNVITPEEGVSLLPLFEGKMITRKTPLFWEHEGNKAVCDGKWKLVSKYNVKEKKFGAWELYDMDTDRSEFHDISAQTPGKVTQLAGEWEAWAKRVGVLSKEEIDKTRAKGGK
jgi:arylsulfatase A-like enzyme